MKKDLYLFYIHDIVSYSKKFEILEIDVFHEIFRLRKTYSHRKTIPLIQINVK